MSLTLQALLVDFPFDFTVFATNALPPKGGTGADAWCTSSGDGFNIASVTQSSGNGNNWTVVFTTPMPSDDYAVVATPVTSSSGTCFIRNRTSTGFQVVTRDHDGSSLALGWTAVVHATNATLPATLTQDMFIMKAGDNMTGDLTLGTDKIVLDAGDGSATFASVNVDSLTLNGTRLSSSGTVNVEAGGASAVNFKSKSNNGYRFYDPTETFHGALRFNDLTADRTLDFPDQSGTVVLKDNSTGALTVDNLTLDGSTLSSSSTLNIDAGGTAAINFKSQATNGYRFYNPANTLYGALKFEDITSDRTFNFPDEAGTIVVKNSTTGALSIDDLTLDGNTLSCSSSPTFQTGNVNGNYIFKNTAGTFNANLRFNNLTSNRSYNFPNNGGTIALTSDISDVSLKENITDAPSQWADVKAARVANFEYTETSGQPSGKHIGWIAQEVQAVSPGCVEEISGVDAEGNPTDESCLAIKTQVMLVKAYKALQEAMERIETLEERLDELTTQ
jgi:hypothetical protein